MQEPEQPQLVAVGLGPGDPELVTVKGRRAIERADVIFAPRSRDDETSRALHIAWPWIDPARQQIVVLTIPMQRDPVRAHAAYRLIAETIGARLSEQTEGRAAVAARGVYLLLGDPLLYGTFSALQAVLVARYPQIAVTIVPGVTSFAAAAARAGLPLSVGDERVAILPAPADPGVLRELLARFETVVLLKLGRALPQMIAVLDELALLEAAVYAEYLGMPEERIVRTVGSLRDYQAPYLSLLIVRREE
ncbi:MAG: precorrin-2 C(20)-methyltransferase [Chloroflexi bacterium]|nr:precorrin-2 C(20)-methyltransferase [Chloroflexota bacterium]